MSKELMQEQLRQLLIAAKLSSADTAKGVAEAKEELLEGQRTLQRESVTPFLSRLLLDTIREVVSTLQCIVDLSHELSLLDAGQAQCADAPWNGHLDVTESGKPGFILRVSHDAARALPWQVQPPRAAAAHRIIAAPNRCGTGCRAGQGLRRQLHGEFRLRPVRPPSARQRPDGRLPRLHAQELVPHSSSRRIRRNGNQKGLQSRACALYLCPCTRCVTRHQLQSADHDAVVEVSLGSPCIISLFPSEDVLRPKGKEPLSTTDRLKWFVRAASIVLTFDD